VRYDPADILPKTIARPGTAPAFQSGARGNRSSFRGLAIVDGPVGPYLEGAFPPQNGIARIVSFHHRRPGLGRSAFEMVIDGFRRSAQVAVVYRLSGGDSRRNRIGIRLMARARVAAS